MFLFVCLFFVFFFFGGGGVIGSIFAGYLPLASKNPYHIKVYFVANYEPHLAQFLAKLTIFNRESSHF